MPCLTSCTQVYLTFLGIKQTPYACCKQGALLVYVDVKQNWHSVRVVRVYIWCVERVR